MGVATKETPFEVAEASDVVITMLPSSSHVSYTTFIISSVFLFLYRKSVLLFASFSAMVFHHA